MRRRPAAARRWAPAATSSTTAATAASSSATARVDGPITSVTSPFGGAWNRSGEDGSGPTDDLLEHLRQLPTDRDRPVGVGRGKAREGRRQALRRFERDGSGAARRATPARAPPAPSRSAAGSRRTGTARPRGRSRRAPSPRLTGPGRTVTATPAAIAARDKPGARIIDAGQTRIGDKRHPLAGREPRHEIDESRRLVVLVVREEPRLDPVALEQDARVARVLAEHRVGRRRAPRARGA